MLRDVKQGLEKASEGAQGTPGGFRLRQGCGGQGAADGWTLAVSLTERWLARSERVDALLEGLAPGLPAQERARAQQLFYGVVRWASRLEAALDGLMAHAPRTKVRAVLLVAGFELLELGSSFAKASEDKAGGVAKVIHHAVEKAKTVASPKEARLVNAVARKMAGRLAERPADPATEWAHPEWLVARWTRQFGADTTRQLLEWNQRPAPVYARWRPSFAKASEGGDPVSPPEFLTPTRWSGFYEVKAGKWEEVRRLATEGALYLQDPSTRLCIELLAPQPCEVILDACAAPGGKSLFIADTMKTGKVVALDEPVAPGKSDVRLVRLKENLARSPKGVEVAMVQADLRMAGSVFYHNLNLPESYDAVLLDAPCSNTGVMRHRIDVKWRLQDGDFARHAEAQVELLHAAARLVKSGGRLVYSTCSLDAAENDGVIKAFFESRAGGAFKLERNMQAYPWIDGHDGAGAFLLVKNG